MPLRPATDSDREAVFELGVAEESTWFGSPEVSAAEVGEWIDEEGGVGVGVVSVDEAGAFRGFASTGRHAAILLADPAQTDAVVDELLPWLQAEADDLKLETYAGDAVRVAAFERHGLRHLRSAFSLARGDDAGPLPEPEIPDGVVVEPYDLGQDDEAVHRLVYVDAAWAEVEGHVERDLEEWRTGMRPLSVLLLARRDDAYAGWVAGRVLESGRGYVHQIATAKSERGRGLGRALLLAAFAELSRAGARGHSLGVMAENEKALGLYYSVGLEIEREFRTYARSSGSTDSP
jgi:mycothiol synthase